MASTRYWFMRDVQKGATLEPVLERSEGTGEPGGVPSFARIFLAGVQGAAGPPDGVNEGVSPSALIIPLPGKEGAGDGSLAQESQSNDQKSFRAKLGVPQSIFIPFQKRKGSKGMVDIASIIRELLGKDKAPNPPFAV